MQASEFYRAVAEATGESVSTIAAAVVHRYDKP